VKKELSDEKVGAAFRLQIRESKGRCGHIVEFAKGWEDEKDATALKEGKRKERD